MRSLLLFTLVSLTAGAGGRFDRFCYQRGDRGFLCDDYAQFEAFPASGAGTSGVCNSTPATGARGEVLPFSRASNGTCTKTSTGGLATSGIQPGDLVVLGSNQNRVEFDGSGALGLLDEGARINSLLRSQEIDNAIWTKEQDAAPRTPTVTADFATAPDGTTTAERVQFPATSGVQFSDFYQTWNAGAAGDATNCSVYVRGNTNSDTTDLCLYNGGAWTCTACAYVSTSWSRCSQSVQGAGAVGKFCKLGNNSNQNGGVARNVADLLVWGVQGESIATGLYPTSYIPTAGLTVTRASEPGMQRALGRSYTTWSIASSVVTPNTVNPAEAWSLQGGFIAYNGVPETAGNSVRLNSTHTAGALAQGSVSAGVLTRYAAAANSSSLGTLCNAGTCNTDAVNRLEDGATNATLTFGNYFTGAFPIDGIISRICVDPDPARCR